MKEEYERGHKRKFSKLREDTLIFPSIRIPSCSYSHIDTVECCCRSLKIKLIGGNSTLPLPPPPRPVIVCIAGVFLRTSYHTTSRRCLKVLMFRLVGVFFLPDCQAGPGRTPRIYAILSPAPYSPATCHPI